jgi:hypothetical protein
MIQHNEIDTGDESNQDPEETQPSESQQSQNPPKSTTVTVTHHETTQTVSTTHEPETAKFSFTAKSRKMDLLQNSSLNVDQGQYGTASLKVAIILQKFLLANIMVTTTTTTQSQIIQLK